jgi:hypothetical protein
MARCVKLFKTRTIWTDKNEEEGKVLCGWERKEKRENSVRREKREERGNERKERKLRNERKREKRVTKNYKKYSKWIWSHGGKEGGGERLQTAFAFNCLFNKF